MIDAQKLARREEIWDSIKGNRPGWDYINSLPSTLWTESAISQRKYHMTKRNWRSDVSHLSAFDKSDIDHVCALDDANHFYRIVEIDNSLIYLHVNNFDGQVNTMVATHNAEQAKRAIEQVRHHFPLREKLDSQTVNIDFWNYTSQGPKSLARDIVVPRWDEISLNYSHKVRDNLTHLMSDFKPGMGGQLLLWHGPPGTAKTYGLRALIWEWRNWCDASYIVDPEIFFGSRADYMMNVLLDDSSTNPWDSDEGAKDPRWRLLILEDTGELLAADAKQRVGQGFSRLLNVVDGLIGQGLRILILVTTNEELKKLDPAVKRPGRCASIIPFTGLERVEAEEWLKVHKLAPNGALSSSTTVAELYACSQGINVPSDDKFGFAA